jgi:hypothetical protein
MGETTLSSITQKLFNPKFLKSFRDPFEEPYPVVYIYESLYEDPEKVELDALYPFMTIQDIKTYIYILKEKDEKYHPSKQALLIPIDDEPSTAVAENYIPLDFAFVDMDKKNKVLNTYSLRNPFDRIREGEVDERFVTANGEAKLLKISDRSANTMEDVFPEVFGSTPVILHLYLYSDLVEGIEDKLKAKKEWNGRVRPYFPDLPMEYETALETSEEQRFLEAKVTYVESTLALMDKLNELIEGETREVPLNPMKMISVKYLRLLWKQPTVKTPDVEGLFYQIPVTKIMPFSRILPTQSVPITKIHVESALRIPSFDPRLISQWAEIKGPSKTDFMFGKVMIRREEGQEPALFGTLRIFEDKSADFLIQPPRELKKFLLRDIREFPELLESVVEPTYLNDVDLDIKDAAVVCQISSVGLRQVTQARFLQRLRAFAPLFQEIPALPNENPLAMLRYRAVSKFTAEDKIFTFLTQYNSRKVVRGDMGESYTSDMIYAVMDTFKIRYGEARELFEKWVAEKDKLALNNAETNDFGPQYNKGVDIAVFAQQSSYSFHLYRVDSMIHLERILTALSLLLSAEDDQLDIEEGVAADFDAAASVVDEEERKDEPVGDEDLGDAVGEADVFDADALGDVVDETVEEVVPQAVVTAKPKAKTVVLETQAKPIREYFTKRLYDADPELFAASEDLRKGKAKDTVAKRPKKETDLKQSYSAKCQAERQPIVMLEEQYDAMLEEYKNDEVTFLEFPLREAVVPKAVGEIVYVLRYGSSSLKMNFYLCCKYFCLRDFIMVLEKDFQGTELRHPEDHGGRTEKEPNTCPFCEGKLIENKRSPGPNQWVLQRKSVSVKKDSVPSYIGLLTHTVHPRGLFQPCCFTTAQTYRSTDAEFQHLSYKQVAEEEVEEDKEEVATVASTREPLNYALSIFNAHKKYILAEKKKIPLEVGDKGGPQIGVLPSLLDPYFQQVDTEIVHIVKAQHMLLPNSRAFLRIGVDNRKNVRAESFFSAIAPFLNLNTADDVRTRLLERIYPRNFLFFNYGNLVLEFYNPSDARPTDAELRLWTQTNLGGEKDISVELAAPNQDAILRLWKSYQQFIDFLADKKALKEYRQFAQMLAMPGFLTVRGIVFIVLDIVKDGDEERLEVRCPPFGYDNNQYADADIGFLIHHHAGIWEPIFYSENERAHKQFGDRHDVALKFQRSMLANWPPIVQKRVLEFTQKCSGSGRAAWTSSSLVDPYALIPVSTLIQGMAQAPEGVIRDTYNHIVALTFRAEAGKPRLVAVPVVDDGTILVHTSLYFDWDDYPAASLHSVVNFYKENIEPIFGYYPGYSVKYAVKSEGTNNIVAVQLTNGIYIPCTVTKSDVESRKLLETMKATEIQEMEWAINRRIIFGKPTNEKPLLQTQERKINEAFEYLRLTFSKWYASDEVSGELRTRVQEILQDTKRYPLFERRKRLDILLGSTIIQWMDQEEEWRDEQKSLLRVDCTVRTEKSCSGQCVWKESESKCLIHVPEADPEVNVNVPKMLMWRLLEELLRYPERRRELLENNVSSLVTLREPVQIKDQYIVPESTLAWEDLKRMNTGATVKEKKKFYEEMSRNAKPVLGVPREENVLVGALPDELKDSLGTEDELEGLYLYRPTLAESVVPSLQPYLVSMGVFEPDIGLEEGSTVLTEDAMRELTLATRRPIIQFNLEGGELSWSQFGPAKRQKDPTPFVLVAMDIDQGGPAMLSLSPTSPVPVPVDRLPSGLKYLYDERVLVSEPAKK